MKRPIEIAFILFVLLIFVFGLQKGLISRLLSTRLFIFLGEISFAMYMSHQLFYRFLRQWRNVLNDNLGELFVAVSVCLLVIPLSYLIYRFIEVPVRKRFKKEVDKERLHA